MSSLQHRIIDLNIEITSAKWCHLSQHDVLRYTSAIINLTQCRSFKQDLHSLFEGTPHQCTGLLSIDTVTRDSHQVALGSHDIDQHG
jgi:hypothetical protein